LVVAIPLSKARAELGDVVNRVSHGGERVLINRNGKTVAAVVSVEDLVLIRRLEDAADLKAALAARAQAAKRGTVPWKKLKAERRSRWRGWGVPYEVEFAPPAAKQFRALRGPIRDRVEAKVDSLAANPRPHGVEKLQGADDLYRVRVGDDAGRPRAPRRLDAEAWLACQ
jgi:prevent-host-death family protein